MTVKNLLKKISIILPTHEVVTLTNSSTKLVIDIKHDYDFHAVGRYDKSDIDSCSFDYTITQPFNHSMYEECLNGEKTYIPILDFEVYRWKIIKDENEYEWTICIETK